MTPAIDDADILRDILANTDALLLDFDGPVCSVFSGFPAPVVADQLRDVLAEGGHAVLPPDVQLAVDPFAVLFYAATLGDENAHYVEAAFRALEADAILEAKPTAGSHDLIRSWKQTGRPLAIVSNNSMDAVAAYLDLHRLSAITSTVAARTSGDVRLQKPSPYLLNEAIRALEALPANCTLVGDSPTDIQAARAANVRSVGYANRPGKSEALSILEPTAITTTMSLLDDVCPTL